MKNRRTWQLFILSVVVFASLSYFLPIYEGATQLLSLALSVTSILFGLLIGFFITQMWNKFSSIRRESSSLHSAIQDLIANMNRLEGNERAKKQFEDRMERFLIAFTMISWDSVEEEDKYFDAVRSAIDDVNPINEKNGSVYVQILDAENQASNARTKLSSLGKQRLMRLEWVVLISLSTIITTSVLLLRDGSLFFNTLSSIMPPLVILTMMMLDDLDNLRWGTEIVSFEPAQQGLEALNKERFYEQRFIDKGWVEEPEVYRNENDLEEHLEGVYDELKLKDCLRKEGILGPKL